MKIFLTHFKNSAAAHAPMGHLRDQIFDFITKLFYYKTLVLIRRSYKKKLIVFLENGARFKPMFGLAPSAAVTSFLEIEL